MHRGWHFRSPDGRKVTDPSQMWMPYQTPPSKVRRTVAPVQNPAVAQATPICPHCNTKFASHNNLRRHIIEVHKKTVDGQDLADVADGVKLDRVGECTKCDVTFSTLAEWVDHKINDAKVRRTSVAPSGGAPSGGGYEWNCEICMKVFTRKERMMQHMLSHLNDREMDPEVLALHQKAKNGETNYVNDESDDEEGEESEVEEEVKPKTFSCELCRVDFASSQELRSHVADHFLNDTSTFNNHQKPQQVDEEDEDESSEAELDTELDIDEDIKQELEEVELEEAQVDYTNPTSVDEDASSSSDEASSTTSPDEAAPAPLSHPPIPKMQVQVHRCRICNAAFLDSARSVECMMNHQKPTNYKCSECQLFFIGSKHLLDHEKLCHS